jgi:hypothetical protein
MATRKKTGRQIIPMSAHIMHQPRTAHGAGSADTRRVVPILCLVVVLSCASLALSKKKPLPSKTISGQVLDTSSRGIMGASVLLTDIQTHKTDAIYSGPEGNYNFSGLNIYHDYEVQARYRGLKSKTRQVSSMDPRPQIVVNLTLPSQ